MKKNSCEPLDRPVSRFSLPNLLTLSFPLLALTSHAADIAKWDFFGESSPATSTADVVGSNLTIGTLSRGAGAVSSTASNSFRTQGFQNNGISTSNTDYFQTTIQAATGFTVSLSTIDAKFAGTGTFAASPGVSNQFAYSLDGTTFTLIGSPQVTIGTPATLTQIDLTGISGLQNVADTTTITLRYYASGQTTTGGWGFNSAASGTYGLAIGGSVAAAGDITPPTLASTTPVNAATGVGVNANLIATFSEDVQKGTGNILIKSLVGDIVQETIAVTDSAVTVTGATVTVDPSITFDHATAYYVEIESGAIKDVSSNANVFAGISGNATWNFTTIAADTSPPFIVEQAPADDDTEVEITSDIAIQFNETVLKGTGSIEIWKTSETGAPFITIDVNDLAVTVSGPNVTINPSINLEASTDYHIIIPAGAFTDTALNDFAGVSGTTTWNFTTEAPDVVAPTLVSVSPVDNAVGVSPTMNLTVTLSENVQKGIGNIAIWKTSDNTAPVETIDVTGTSVMVSGATVTINPLSNLQSGTEYHVIIDAGAITDLAAVPNAFAGITVPGAWSFTTFTPGQLIISQVYGGGGNSGSTFRNDFIELHNNSAVPLTIQGWSLQYSSPTGSFSALNVHSLPTFTIPSGGYFLVQQAVGSGGTANLPTPDATGSLALGAAAGKVALVADTNPTSGPTASLVSDFVGYGSTANQSETSPAPAPSNTVSISRTSQGTADTNNNSVDFVVGTGVPVPRNSSTPPFNPSASAFTIWVTGAPHNLSGANAAFGADPDNDGIPNSIEFIVGGNPIVHGDASSYLPTITLSGAVPARTATIVFHRSQASAYLSPVLQISPDLGSWDTVFNGINDATVTVDSDFYGTGFDKVTVTVPANESKGFARIFATGTP